MRPFVGSVAASLRNRERHPERHTCEAEFKSASAECWSCRGYSCLVSAIEDCVTLLEATMQQLATAQLNSQRQLDQLTREDRRVVNELADVKADICVFQDETRAFKDETQQDRRSLNRMWGDLANKLGTIVEDIVAPNVRRLAVEEFSIDFIDDFFVRRLRWYPQRRRDFAECDVVCVGGGKALLVESKSTPAPATSDVAAPAVRP